MNKLEKQCADYLNMMSAPLSKEYEAEITRSIGSDMIIFKYRSRTYSAFYKNNKVNAKSIRVE